MNIKNIQNNTVASTLRNQEVVRGEQQEKNVLEKNELDKSIQERTVKEVQDGKKAESQKSFNGNLPEDPEKLKKALGEITDGLNEMVKVFNRKLDFMVHEDTKRLMVKVVDTDSGKTVREIPPKEILDLVARMRDALSLLIDVRI